MTMGMIYCGPLADAINSDDHEGCALRVLPDGTETGTWTWETRKTIAYRAVCSCGWRATNTHPPSHDGQAAAEDQWDTDHLQPILNAEARRHTITFDRLLDFARDMDRSAWCETDATGRAVLTERGRGACDVIEQLEQLLDEASRS